jgi:hypothetical protein
MSARHFKQESVTLLKTVLDVSAAFDIPVPLQFFGFGFLMCKQVIFGEEVVFRFLCHLFVYNHLENHSVAECFTHRARMQLQWDLFAFVNQSILPPSE